MLMLGATLGQTKPQTEWSYKKPPKNKNPLLFVILVPFPNKDGPSFKFLDLKTQSRHTSYLYYVLCSSTIQSNTGPRKWSVFI